MALRAAEALGVGFRLEQGRIRFINGERLSQEQLAELWRQRAELTALLAGETCRRCGRPMAWPQPCGVVYGDGTAEHHDCRLTAAAGRALAGVVATSDEGELVVGGEP